MATIEVNVKAEIYGATIPHPPKARIPRKLKKDIKKVAGSKVYHEMMDSLQEYYNHFGYQKFNIHKVH